MGKKKEYKILQIMVKCKMFNCPYLEDTCIYNADKEKIKQNIHTLQINTLWSQTFLLKKKQTNPQPSTNSDSLLYNPLHIVVNLNLLSKLNHSYKISKNYNVTKLCCSREKDALVFPYKKVVSFACIYKEKEVR